MYCHALLYMRLSMCKLKTDSLDTYECGWRFIALEHMNSRSGVNAYIYIYIYIGVYMYIYIHICMYI